MKKILITLMLVAFSATSAFAVVGVKDSAHDLSDGSGTFAKTGEIRICAFCHTPHHAIDSLDYAPLWAHASSTETFTPYSSPTLEADRGGDALRGGSRLCMGCHDGAVAPDAYYGQVGTMAPGTDAWNDFGIAEGGDMTNDHPVGFSYGQAIGDDATANGGFMQFNPAATLITSITDANGKAGDGIITVGNLLRAVAGGPSDLVTCASCHDVHNSAQVYRGGTQGTDAFAGTGADTSEKYFLYVTQENSGLCVTCHKK